MGIQRDTAGYHDPVEEPSTASTAEASHGEEPIPALNELWRTRRNTIASSPAYLRAFEDADRTAF
jgi:hypothetical protein